MLTGQMYSGKGEDATLPQQNGSTFEQTVDSEPRAAATATAEPAESQATGPQQPPLTTEGNGGQTTEPIRVELPYYFRWSVQSDKQATNTIAAIERVFYEFHSSEVGKKSDEDLNLMLAYGALRMAFVDLITQAATQRLGSFTKPKPSQFLFDLPVLATGDPQLDNAPVLADDPTTCTDMTKLHEWVSTLQQMCRLQQKIHANYEKIDAANAKTIQTQEEAIGLLERQVKIHEQATAANIRREQDLSVPTANHYISLPLYLTGGYESEVVAVRMALTEASKAKLKQVLKHIKLDQTEDAFFANEEYRMLQVILSRLSDEVAEVAINNHARQEYTVRPDHYLSNVKAAHNKLMRHKEAFINRYQVFTLDHQEADGPESTAPEATTQPQEDEAATA